MNIEVLPSLRGRRSLCQRLEQSIELATALRAVVAFWTTEPDFISSQLSKLLSHSDSYLCVDLHPPTDIDQLNALTNQNANVKLHIRKLDGRTENRNTGMPPHLLHAKTLLFDLPNGKAELWVGSHNWTRRALLGFNIELSAIIQLERESALYQDVKDKLDEIARLCVQFDSNEITYYKWLQGLSEGESKSFIELEGEKADTLANSEIAIFGTDYTDLKQINKLSEVYLAIFDSIAAKQMFYRAEVVTVSKSRTDIQDLAARLSASKQRFAFRKGRSFLKLELPSTPSLAQFHDANYYLTLQILDQLPSQTEVREPLQSAKWSTDSQDPLIAHLRASDSRLRTQKTAGREDKRYEIILSELLRRVAVKVPVNKTQMHKERQLTLAEKRELSYQDIVTQKILVKPEK